MKSLLHLLLIVLFAAPPFTRAADAPRKRDEPNRGGYVDLSTQDTKVASERFKLQSGYDINLFASEKEFPELSNPVAMTFDSKGRLWVATMPSYPQYNPPNKPNDKIIILEDTDADGKADKASVFAEGLHLPTGLELGNGGLYVASQPNLQFLKDTDGDGKADTREIILHGLGSEDSHHAVHAFYWGPDGGLYFHEGTFHASQVETPYGPLRLSNSGAFRFYPRTWRTDVFVSFPFANPWGHVFDRWGQNFIADASGGQNYFGYVTTRTGC
ncbi:MAG: PVC-type heme-binding CxxCH protein, partial [Verrucomicrobiota bacterium]